MSVNSAGCLNCSLTRYLEEVSAFEADRERAVFAAVMLTYLGFFQSNPKALEGCDLRRLMEMLAKRKHDKFSEELQKRCMPCIIKVDCPVGQIVLKD